MLKCASYTHKISDYYYAGVRVFFIYAPIYTNNEKTQK